MEESLPPGFRFHPTDEELITHYLSCKVSDVCFTAKAITDVDLNKCEPWDLPGKASMGEKEWYFFSVRDRKYPTGLRTNRATEAGYWKTTGKDKEIESGGVVVGMKKTLVFYRGRAPRGEKSNWVMHEYRLDNKFKSSKEEWVLCRVFQKSLALKKPHQQLDDESPCNHNLDLSNNNSSIPNSSPNALNNNNHLLTMNMNMNMNMNSSNNLLNSNLSLNSLLLKAFHLRTNSFHQPTQGDYSYQGFATDFQAPHQEQPFHLDSFW